MSYEEKALDIKKKYFTLETKFLKQLGTVTLLLSACVIVVAFSIMNNIITTTFGCAMLLCGIISLIFGSFALISAFVPKFRSKVFSESIFTEELEIELAELEDECKMEKSYRN